MHQTPEITRLIHENFATILYFAFGQPIITTVIKNRFVGECKYLNKTVYERAEILADRALLEMSTQLRVLDDAEDINEAFKKSHNFALGQVVQSDGNITPLYLRDMTNKVIHASRFNWDMSLPEDPKIMCMPTDGSRWREARIDIIALMAFMTSLMY